MAVSNVVRKNSYYDSVTLMLLSNQMSQELGSKNVAVMMATDTNKKILRETNLLTEEGEKAGPNDLIFAASCDDTAAIDSAFKKAEEYLNHRTARTDSDKTNIVKTLDSALQKNAELNLAVISVPGKYAKREALKALDAGLHVLLFSDNVSLEDEIDLKDTALSKGLLMMGPDCGTAIINGVALGFANVVERGDIGIVAAAGTGSQEVSTLVCRYGGGISQALGTGSRDVKEGVGGKMMLAGIEALAKNRGTKVIVLVSKPPSQKVLDRIAQKISEIKKPAVACFLGANTNRLTTAGCTAADTLEEAAQKAVGLSRGKDRGKAAVSLNNFPLEKIISDETSRLQPSQKYIRGLYAGGTLCYEALVISAGSYKDIYSNTPIHPEQALPDPMKSQKHTFLDLGADEFTLGRPHPMIEPGSRNERILTESQDAETAVVLLDNVIGYGAHSDPAGVVASAIIEAKEIARKEGRGLSVLASVCGTEKDPQNREEQIEKLKDAGVIVMPSNAQAVKMAVLIAGRGKL